MDKTFMILMLKMLSFRFVVKFSIVSIALGLYSCNSSTKTEAKTNYSINNKEEMNDSITAASLLMPYLFKGEWGFIDTDGQLIIPTNYKSAHGFTEGLAAVKIDSSWGFIDKNNRLVIEPKFDSCQPFFGNRAAVMYEGLWGFINHAGDIRIPLQYEHVKPFCEGFAAVSDGNKWGFIDTSNNIIIDFIYDEVLTGFYSGKANVISGGNLFSIDRKGNKHPYSDNLEIFSDGLAVKTGSNKKKGYVNASGEFVIPPKYFIALKFNEGLAGVGKLHDPVGFIDTSGKIVIQPNYLLVGHFDDGLASAQDYDSRNWGFIDKQGKWMIKPVFWHAGDFSGNCAPVAVKQSEWQLINRKGEFVTDIYKDIVTVKSGLSLPGGLPGFGNVNGLMRKDAPLALLINETEFENLFWALTDEGWIIIRSNGQKVISEPQPDRAAFN